MSDAAAPTQAGIVLLPGPDDATPPSEVTIAAIDENSECLRLLEANTGMTVVAFDADGFLWANQAAERLTGYTRQELRGISPLEVLRADARAYVVEALRSRAGRNDRIPSRFEVAIRRRDGEERWLEVTVSPFAMGSRPAGLATGFDITERRRLDEARRGSEERLRLAQQAAEIVSWDWNFAGDRFATSGAIGGATELSADGLLTADQLGALIHPQDLPRVQTAVRRAIDEGIEFLVEHRVNLPTGTTRWLAARGQVVRDENGRPARLVGVSLDITNRKLAEEALFQEKERAQVTLASIGDGVIRTDARGMIDYMNPAAERLTGWPLPEAYGKHVREPFRVVDPLTQTLLLDPVTRCLAEGRTVEFPGERMLSPRGAPAIAIRDSASPIVSRAGRVSGAVLVFKDVTELRMIEQERSFYSTHDPLTGLVNRKTFEDEVGRAVASARSERIVHTLAYLDLDQFRLVNETSGHLAGDELLKQIVQRLVGCLDPHDLLARVGGDEFAVLFRETPLPRALLKAQELRRALEESRLNWGDRSFELLTSIGLVPISETTRDGDAALAAADAACAVAKERGGNRVHEYRPSDHAIARRVGDLQWVQEIHQAFENERFRLYVQRIVPLQRESEKEPLAEIFIRMRTDRGEVLPTASFISAAERYHLISTMDRWVIHESFTLLGPRRSRPVSYAGSFTLNLSGQSLGEEALLEHVLRELEKSRIDPRRVCFEITETAAIANLNSALRFISALKNLGCRFVLDDFGSGFSSFAYLKNLPVDFLKIDASFTRQLAADRIQRALVESIQQLGRVLGMKTIAEGVEEEGTLAVIRDLGVDYAQGFVLHRPAPLAEEPDEPTAS